MIKLTDARLTDALPKTLAEQPWVQALAEASRKMRRRVMAYADRTRLFCDIGEASEEALDALAVELQTPLYKNDYPLTVKRQIVKNSMLYYIRSGTRGAVEELLADIYQGAEAEEWFEYGGKPNYFRVAIDISRTTVPVAEMTPAELESWLYSVKRASSALESLSYMIRHAITIGCKVEAFLQSPPECGTLECGTYPEASTLGWSAGAWLQIAGRADAYLVSPPECGTVPEISTVGWSIDAAISQAGSVADGVRDRAAGGRNRRGRRKAVDRNPGPEPGSWQPVHRKGGHLPCYPAGIGRNRVRRGNINANAEKR